MKKEKLKEFIKNSIKEMSTDEFEKAKEAERLANHPERDKIMKIRQLINKEKDPRDNFTDDDWENFYLDADLPENFKETVEELGYLNEYGEFRTQETEYKQELDSMFGDYRPFISLGKYSDGRPDSDPLKDKGFGDVSFVVRNDLPEDEWKKALDWVESKGFEIQSQSNEYELEFDGDRAWYPKIKFHFNANKFDTE